VVPFNNALAVATAIGWTVASDMCCNQVTNDLSLN